MINYSIIIPHYNIPELLKRCLTSIPERDDLEIIVVDDCSSSTIVDFSSFPGISHQNLTIIRCSQNGGGGRARNIGLKHALGKYVIFADADDFFCGNFTKLLDDFASQSFDVAYFNACSVDSLTLEKSNRALLLNSWMDRWYIYHDNENDFKYRFGEPWCKIISRNLIENYHITFDESPIHNDTHFSYIVGFYAKNILIDIRVSYCVTMRANSTCKRKSIENSLVRIDIFSKQDKFYKQNRIPVVKNEHFAELTRLLIKNIRFFRKGFRILRYNGFSYCEIFYGLFRQILSNLKYDLFYGKNKSLCVFG